VYNGGTLLRRALDSLLAQDYPSLEIVIRDNASKDDTEIISREYAARDPRIRYVRNPSNVGVVGNFRLALGDATGKYFMWAAHDDLWGRDYVSRLARALMSHPGAVLAAGRAVFVEPDGSLIPNAVDSHAPGGARDPCVALLEWHATHWIYGIFVRDRLVEFAPELWRHRPWGGDMVWLMRLSASHEVAGDDEAAIYKTLKPSIYEPKLPRDVAAWQFWYGGSIIREILASPLPVRRKVRGASAAATYWWRYVTAKGYRHLASTWLAALRKEGASGA
jgi:glycosyltransferase involved in cell wall biosynthesis